MASGTFLNSEGGIHYTLNCTRALHCRAVVGSSATVKERALSGKAALRSSSETSIYPINRRTGQGGFDFWVRTEFVGAALFTGFVKGAVFASSLQVMHLSGQNEF
jgi:hypothetical protein